MTYIPGREILITVTRWRIPASKALLIAALVLFFILVPKGSSISIHALYGATFCYNIKTYLIFFFIISHHSCSNCTLRSKPSSCVCFSILLASSSFGDLERSFLHFYREMTNRAGGGSSTIWSMTPSAPGVIQIRFWSLSIRLCHCGPAVPLSGESLPGLVSQWTLEAFLPPFGDAAFTISTVGFYCYSSYFFSLHYFWQHFQCLLLYQESLTAQRALLSHSKTKQNRSKSRKTKQNKTYHCSL